MATIQSIQALDSGNVITLHYKGDTIHLQKDGQFPKEYEEIKKLIADENVDELINAFFDVKQKIETYTQNKFTVDEGRLVAKKDGKQVNKAVAKRLINMQRAGKDFMPLWRFWQKLSQNPSENSRQQLYGFIVHNDIEITELGDLLCEKGVRETHDGRLVDIHTEKLDNSVGMVVEMPRDKVNDDKHVTCSTGLHVGAPKYVRQWYFNDIIVECVVNPKDVVSVPVDYNNTKMRVCRYQVAGIADKSRQKDLTVKLEDVVEMPKLKFAETRKIAAKSDDDAPSGALKEGVDWVKLIASKIKEEVKKRFSVDISHMNNKNKKSIVNRAAKIEKEFYEQRRLDFSGKTCKEIIDIVGDVVGSEQAKQLAGASPRRARYIKKVTPILAQEGYAIIDNK